MASTRAPDLRRIRVTTTYSVPEIAALFSVHRNTVFRWIKYGMTPLDDSRPVLVHGSEIHRYLKQRRLRRKSTCAHNEMLCFRCRAPRRALADTVVISQQSAQTVTFKGVCSTCGCTMFRAGAAKNLHSYEESFGHITRP
jgi:hypothetical protein